MALVTTLGGETSDSYVSVSEADRFFQNHFSLVKTSLWATLSGPRKESVLRRACQQLETLKVLDNEFASGSLPTALLTEVNWEITIHKLEPNQRLQFPRNVDVDSSNDGYVPQEVKDSQCEQAVHLLSMDDTTINLRQQGILEEAQTAGPVKNYVKYAGAGESSLTYLSPMAIELMRPFLRWSAKVKRS